MIKCSFENGNIGSLRHVVVDSLVVRGEQILLAKRANNLLEGGKWCLIGGFVERGETIQAAVRREVMEEVGYEIRNVTLFRIIDSPDRQGEDRQNIAFVHICTASEEKIGVSDCETAEERWFPLSALPDAKEFAFDHFSSIQMYRSYLERPFPLPVFK